MDYCSVCSKRVESSIITPCKHAFHVDCLKKLSEPKCPVCKENISEFIKNNNLLVNFNDYIDNYWKNINNRKKLPKYIEYKKMIDKFFELCKKNDVLCRRDFTCCNSCGNAEIDDENDPKITYTGYIFYHTQTTDNILDQIENDNDTIHIYLCWGIFNSKEPTSTEYDIFAEKMIKLAEQFTKQHTKRTKNPEFSLEIKYDKPKNINSKLNLIIKFI